MKSALIKGVLFYAIGYGIAIITFLTLGHEYIHAPAPFHFVIFIIFVIGSIWFVVSTLKYLFNRSISDLGHMIPHGINTLVIVIGMYFILYPISSESPIEKPSNEISIEHHRDSTMMYHWNNLIYLKVSDSVIFNVKDSVITDFTNYQTRNN